MAITGEYKYYIVDTTAERDNIAASLFYPEGTEVYVKDESIFYKWVNGAYVKIGGGSAVLIPGIEVGDEEKFVRVKTDRTGFEFVTLVGGGDMLAANNLSDVVDPDEARDNINAEEAGAAAAALIAAEAYTDLLESDVNSALALKADLVGGKVPSAQLPAYVDDVLEYANFAALPVSGTSEIIYVTLDDNKTFRWSGSAYVEISSSLALGETSSTAYRGDRGKIAYDHSQVAHAPSDAQKNSDITKAEIEAKLTGSISSHTHASDSAKQDHDTDLDDIAALNSATAGVIASTGSGWLQKTYAQLKTLLILVKADVGLSNSDNTSDVNKPVSTAQQTALDLKEDKVAGKGLSANDYTNGAKAKVDFITVTQPVDLDDIETRVNNLDAAVVLKGTWDASAGTFPGGGTAQAGASYIISVGGTVDSVVFAIGDRIIAITDNASTATFAANWFKADYTDQVLSVNGLTGAVTLTTANVADSANKRYCTDAEKTVIGNTSGTNTGDSATPAETVNTIGALINGAGAATPNDTDLVGTADASVLKKITWTNVKAFLKTYFDTIYQTLAKDATGGYAGLTLFKINFKNAANTFTSFFTNTNTAARTYTFQDRNGTIADDTDLATKQATLVSATNIKTINGSSILGAGDLTVSAADLDSVISAASTISANKNRVIGGRYFLDARLTLDGRLMLI